MKIGIIGCGQIVRLRHAPECLKNPKIEIAGFFDLVQERAEELVDKFGGKVYTAYQDMIHDPGVEAVIVCTANKTHAPISIEALHAYKHVLCEKPMAITMDEAVLMDKVAEETGKILMAAHNQRFDRVHIKAKQLLKSGVIGDVVSFRSEFSHGGAENWSISASKSWFFKKNEAVFGAVADLGVHKVDLIQWMLEDEFSSVSALVKTLEKKDSEGNFIGVDDNAVYLLMTKNGVMGTIYSSWSNHGKMDNSTTIYGTKGVMQIYNPCSPYDITITNDKEKETQNFHINAQEGSGVVDAFADAVLNGKVSPVSSKDAISGLRVIFAAQRSADTGRVVEIL